MRFEEAVDGVPQWLRAAREEIAKRRNPVFEDTDRGVHLDPIERMCKEIVEGGFRPVEAHTRPFLFTHPKDGHKQIYLRGLAWSMLKEGKNV
jgi:hypothetical protein